MEKDKDVHMDKAIDMKIIKHIYTGMETWTWTWTRTWTWTWTWT
jgi:hypothetical protein